MIRRTLFVLLFAVSLAVATGVGFFINEYLHLKKDYEDLRVISRNMLMENEKYQETARSCLTSLDKVRSRLFVPTMDLDLTNPPVPMKLAQGR